MDIITEIEKRLSLIEMRLSNLEYTPLYCSCKCHSDGLKFLKREQHPDNKNMEIAVSCCKCPVVLS